MNKPQEILELEKLLQTEFKKVGIEEVIKHRYEKFIDIKAAITIRYEKIAEYCQDSKGNIIGLRIVRFELEEIPTLVSKLEHLIHLDLSLNKIETIEDLKDLKNIIKLDLGWNNIKLIKNLKNLVKLQWLILESNKIESVEIIKGLIKLQRLDLSFNNIKSIDALKNLKSLQVLFLTKNKIEIVESLENLTNLQVLLFNHNNIESITTFKNLKGIKRLHLAWNKIKSIEALKELKNLEILNLRSNQILVIEALKELKNLEILDLSSNPITTLPKWVCSFPKMNIQWANHYLEDNVITFYDNPIKKPPIYIIQQGKEAIRNYFEKIEEEGEKYLFESKVLIIGEGGAGKTSFAVKIQDEHAALPEDEASTLGIEVSHWNFDIQHQGQTEKMYVNLWDFGGQKVYRGTHQLFFAQKSFYVLLDDSRAEKMEHSYWLNTLEQLAGEQSKVLILTNKKHGHSKSLDENGLKGRFGKIIHDFVELDLKNDKKEIISLRKDLQHILPKMEGMGDPVPNSWVKIREELAQIKKNWISYDAYFDICEKHNSDISEKDIGFMSDYFNRIGVFTHYYDDTILKNRVFLNSNWLLHIVYEVLNHKLVKDNLGKITKADLQEIWSEDKRSIKKEYLRPLMQRFGMMYEIKEEQRYIVPQHLSPEQPYTAWKHEKSGDILQFAYEFDKYMPSGIMPRLIVALQDCIKNHKLVWQKGVNLSYENSHAEITETYDKTNKYLIRICGKKKKELLGIINREFGKILAPFQNLQYEKLVPCICGECKGVAKPYFFEYSSLKKRKEKGKQSIECDRSYEPVNVIKLLEGVSNQPPSHTTNQTGFQNLSDLNKIKIFVSYSSGDRKLRETFADRLRVALKGSKNKYDIWTDLEIPIGESWNNVIQNALENSKIGVLLVSPNFLASEYAMEDELEDMLKRRREEGYLIVPVLLRTSQFFNNKNLAAMQFFKTYKSEYDVTDLNEVNKLMPLEDLIDIDKPKERLINRYFQKLAKQIDTAVEKQGK